MTEQEKDHIWELWCSLDDKEPSCELIRACLYFVDTYGFDPEQLPHRIGEIVQMAMKQDYLESTII